MRFSLWPRLGIGCLAAVLFAGCGPRETRVQQGNREGVLHAAIAAEPQTLDPHLAVAFSDMQVILAFFEGLTAIDEATSRVVPAAAERWEVSADGLTWTFHLRPGLRWSDGEPITAQTFRDSFVRALAPSIASEYAYVLFPLKNAARFNAGEIPDFVGVGVKAVDAHTLTFETTAPTPALPAILSLPVAFPVPLHVLRARGGTINRAADWTRPGVLVGNGPFRLTAWSADQHVRGERNPQFRDAAAVALNGVAFYPYANAASQEAAFRAGQLHVTSDLPLSKVGAYRRDAPAQLRLDPFLQTAFIRFNTTRPPLDDVRVRRALALAIDRNALAAHVLTGGQRAAIALTPPGTDGFTATTELRFDPERARALLAEAGFSAGAKLPALEVQTRPREIDQQVLEAIQQMWRRELGVVVEIALKEQRVWLNDEHSLNYQLSNGAWIGDFIDPTTFLSLFTADSGYNATGWSDPDYDAALDRAARASTDADRFAAYQAAETLLAAASPITPLYHGTQPFLIREEVHGWPPSLLGFHRYQNVRLETPPPAPTDSSN